ncbi:MAG: hypothetical protein HJJLKODD_00273 [Phycisphaerae bacterium]|nr:hypothetical protein [Phycisphaerae bacterium]
MRRAYYHASIRTFQNADETTILGRLVQQSSFAVEARQRDAWLEQIRILRSALTQFPDGYVYFEYGVPRLGKRIDVVVIVEAVIFVIEFKVGESEFTTHAYDQVYDYALDLKHFHESSHMLHIAPILLATEAMRAEEAVIYLTPHNDRLLKPIRSTVAQLPCVMAEVLAKFTAPPIDVGAWEQGRYCPTPTIIEAATALYAGHNVQEISRSDASAINLNKTSRAIAEAIQQAHEKREKVICFITGVPGAGKTLVGLNIATQYFNTDDDMYSVFLSGNGPLVAILREALARDKVRRDLEAGKRTKIGRARSEVKAFIQNVHHFRDDCLSDMTRPPVEHVALFDEAQRAWNLDQTAKFMKTKKNHPNFAMSEPEYLISCLDRHDDWAVIICLVGGGQEINTGEAGIGEWIESVRRSFPHWRLLLSPRLTDSEYAAGQVMEMVRSLDHVVFRDELHLGVSMRSFRAEHVSLLVKQLLELDTSAARETLRLVSKKYPIRLTRDLNLAKQWLRRQARGSERYGVVVSSQAQRLKPHAIDVRSPLDPIHWFLCGKEDVRSSYYLEDAATEFHVQGLELDWVCVVWDGDFRYTPSGWDHNEFCGDHWQRVRKAERQIYLKNAYRVLLTRARQGMVIVVPEGDSHDPTRAPAYYNPVWDYLVDLGFEALAN